MKLFEIIIISIYQPAMPVVHGLVSSRKTELTISFTESVSSETNTYDMVCLIHYRITIQQKIKHFPRIASK